MPIPFFTFPFAGGNKFSFRCFEEHCPSFLEYTPLEYPGRGLRSGEPLLNEFDLIADDLYGQILPVINETDYILYGHSMGAQLAWLLAHKIRAAGKRPPLHLFVSGAPGPSSPMHSDKKRHLLDRDEFLQELKNLDDRFAELLDHEELMDYFEPVLRADFMACENYTYPGLDTIDLPITVFFGDQDNIETEEIRRWEKETVNTIDFIEVEGKHFFILANAPLLLKIISKKVRCSIVSQ